MKTNQRSRATFRYHSKMQSHKATYRRDARCTDKPIVHDIFLSLEELWIGCTKKMKIAAKVFDEDRMVVRTEEKIVKVEVLPGTRDGAKFVVPSAGDKKPGTVPADVIFFIRERRHPCFTRDEENNLIYKANISLREALTGCNIQIPLLGGESLNLSTEDVVSHGTCMTIPGKGMPKGGENRGDLLVEFYVSFPVELTEPQKEAISSILPD